jgi:hypothetical protein
MLSKAIRVFICSVAGILIVTAFAKFISATGDAPILGFHDPILLITFRQVLWFVGGLEMMVASLCIFSKRREVAVGLIVWLATSFVGYRLGLAWTGYKKPCPCLGMGEMTGALGISSQAIDSVMKIVLAYMLVGGCAAAFFLWRQRRTV